MAEATEAIASHENSGSSSSARLRLRATPPQDTARLQFRRKSPRRSYEAALQRLPQLIAEPAVLAACAPGTGQVRRSVRSVFAQSSRALWGREGRLGPAIRSTGQPPPYGRVPGSAGRRFWRWFLAERKTLSTHLRDTAKENHATRPRPLITVKTIHSHQFKPMKIEPVSPSTWDSPVAFGFAVAGYRAVQGPKANQGSLSSRTSAGMPPATNLSLLLIRSGDFVSRRSTSPKALQQLVEGEHTSSRLELDQIFQTSTSGPDWFVVLHLQGARCDCLPPPQPAFAANEGVT